MSKPTLTTQQLKQKSISGAVSYFGRTLLLQAIGLISAYFLGVFLSPEDFGIYGFVLQIIGILVFFSDIGLAAALIQKKDEPTPQEYATVFTVQQLLSLLIVLVAGGIIATGFIESKTGKAGVWVLLSLAISFPLATLKTIPSVQLERDLLFNKLVIPQIFEQFVFHGVVLYFAWKQFGALSYAYAIVARSVIGVLVMYLIQPWRPQWHFSRSLVLKLVSYGGLFQINDFLARVKDQLFFVVLGAFLPLRSFGFVQWSKTWSMYPYNLTVQNVMAITFPTFSRLQDRPDLLKKAIETSLFFITVALFPILVGMSVFVFPFVTLTPSYAKWLPALPSLVFFALSIGWGAISTPLTNTLNATGRITQTLKLMTLWTTLTWLVTPLCVWWFGFTGVAIAAFLISWTSILSVWYAQKIVKFSFWNMIRTPLFASLAMALAALLGLEFWSQSYFWLLTGILLSGTVYVLGLGLFGWRMCQQQFAILLNKNNRL